jgi:hypothetical protein
VKVKGDGMGDYEDEVIEPEIGRIHGYYNSEELSSPDKFRAATERIFMDRYRKWPWLVRNWDALWNLMRRFQSGGIPAEEPALYGRLRQLRDDLRLADTPTQRRAIRNDIKAIKGQVKELREAIPPREEGERWNSVDTKGHGVIWGINRINNTYVQYAAGTVIDGIKVGGRFVKRTNW